MIINYQYRIYPTTEQKLQLNEWLRICRYWYNRQLGERFHWWENNRTSVNACPLLCALPIPKDKPNFYSQKSDLPKIKKDLVVVKSSGDILDFTSVPSQTLQDVSKRADLAFSRFIKGDSNGSKAGKPRFKNKARYRTLKVEGTILKLVNATKKYLYISCSKLSGDIKARYHRSIPKGFNIKNALITKKADGWYISLCLEDKSVPQFNPDTVVPDWDNSIGLDVVLHEDDYLATSKNTKLPALKSFRKNQNLLASISRKKAAKRKGSKARRKLSIKEAKLYQKIARSRQEHAYKTGHKLLRTGCKVFFVENLNIKGLSKRNKAKQDDNGSYLPNGQSAKSGLNKSWLDAGFSNFFETLEYIAEKAGSRVIKVKPQYTSQLLSYRDEFIFTDCGIRDYYDSKEALLVDRDINAAINIKRVGLGLFPTISRRKGNPVVKISTTNSTSTQILKVLRNS